VRQMITLAGNPTLEVRTLVNFGRCRAC
jgi:hypothetical protein